MTHSVLAIFCEDIRSEKNDQYTLVGVLPDNIAVPQFPGALPKLGIYVRAQIETGYIPKEIVVSFHDTTGAEIPLSNWDAATIKKASDDSKANNSPTYGLIMTAVISPFRVPALGKAILTVAIDRVKYAAGLLNFISDGSTASSQPASQSPPAS